MFSSAEHPWIADSCSSNEDAQLLHLPDDILFLVFHHIDWLGDAVCLALSDGKLFEIGLYRLDQLYKRWYARWAGQRVLLLGELTEIDDFPEHLKTTMEQEVKRMKKSRKKSNDGSENNGDNDNDSTTSAEEDVEEGASDDEDDGDNTSGSSGDEDTSGSSDEDDEGDGRSRNSVFSLVCRRYAASTKWFEPKLVLELMDILVPWSKTMDRSHYAAFRSLLVPRYPNPDELILCNLSKGEFVRAAAIPDGSSDDAPPPFYWRRRVTLNQALLSQICWSTQPTMLRYSSGNDPLFRGKWAGDRFEVVTMDTIRSYIHWRDVSEEVVALLAETLRAKRPR